MPARKVEYAYEREIGTRREGGTDWPITAVVYKTGDKDWTAAVLCNGIATQVRQFGTRRDAIAYASDAA